MFYPNLAAHIQSYISLKEEQLKKLMDYFQPLEVEKHEIIFKEGHICKNNYFVEQGCLCMYFTSEKGIEKITHFAIENWWLSDYASFGGQSHSTFNIKGVENSMVLALDFKDQELLLEEIPQLERYFRLVLQRAYAAAQLRIKFQYDFSREELYEHFKKAFPEFVNRVPQYMLASYLGFTPEYLSEIRKKKHN